MNSICRVTYACALWLILFTSLVHAQDPDKRKLCTIEEFKVMLLRQDMELFACSNLEELVNESLDYGEVGAHVVLARRKDPNEAFIMKFIELPFIEWSRIDDNSMTALDCLLFCEKNQAPGPIFKKVVGQIKDLSLLRNALQRMAGMRFSKVSEEKDFELRMQYTDVMVSHAREQDKRMTPDEKDDPFTVGFLPVIKSAYLSMIASSFRYGHKDIERKLDFFLDKYFDHEESAESDREEMLRIFFQAHYVFNSVNSTWRNDEYLRFFLQRYFYNGKDGPFLLRLVLKDGSVKALEYLIKEGSVSPEMTIGKDSLLTYAMLSNSWQSTFFLMDLLGAEKLKHTYVKEEYVKVLAEMDGELFKYVVDKFVTLGLVNLLANGVDRSNMTLVEKLNAWMRRSEDAGDKNTAIEVRKMIGHLKIHGVE